MEWKNGVASLNFLTFEQNAADAVQLPVIRYLFSVIGGQAALAQFAEIASGLKH